MCGQKEKIIELIKKLMLKDEHLTEGCEAERDAAMSKVQELIIKYRITNEDLEDKEETKVVSEVIHMENMPWVRIIFNHVCKLNFCNYLYVVDKSKSVRAWHYVYGQPLEAEMTLKLVVALVKNVARQARMEAKNHPHDRAFQRSFLNAAASRIACRCIKMMDDVKNNTYETSSKALIVISDQYEKADKENTTAINNEHEKIISKGPIKIKNKSWNGTVAGDEFGKNVKIKD